MSRSTRTRAHCIVLAAIAQLALWLGCAETKPEAAVPIEPKTLQPISVVFVDLPDVAAEVARQWSAQRSGKISTVEISANELFANNYGAIANHDIIVYPGTLLGSLVADKLISELPAEVWDSPDYENPSLLRLSRTTLARFGKDRWAIPIANPHFIMLVRKDVLVAIGEPVPQSWGELFELKKKLATRKDLADADGNRLPTSIVLPSADGWASKSLLMIAASRIRHRGVLDSLFDRRTMAPLLENEPFEMSLEELKQLAEQSPGLTPAEVTRSFFSGQAAIAFSWPSRSHVPDPSADRVAELHNKVEIQRVPGSDRWFDFSERAWRPVDAGIDRVELVGFASRQASLLRSAIHPTEAHDFLVWLGSKQICGSIFSHGEFSSPTRTSHLGNVSQWTGAVFDRQGADRFSDLMMEINEEPVLLLMPRISGSWHYFNALEASVQQCLAGKVNSRQTLQETAEQWNAITERYGRDRQMQMLRLDLGY